MRQDPAPTPELDERFGDGPEPVSWAQVEEVLGVAEVYWITTTKADGQPHITPLIGVLHEGAVHVATGPDEQKARNLQRSPRATLVTGCNRFAEGLDVVVEAEAVRVTDEDRLRLLSLGWITKYGTDWSFDVVDGAFQNVAGGTAHVYRLRPNKVLAFTRGPYTQTRFRFS